MNNIYTIKQLEWFHNEKTNRIIENHDFVNLSILAIINLVIGLYLISTTVLIAKDGVVYIDLAKIFTDNKVEAFRNPLWGYPLLIHLMHKITGLFYDAASLQSWIISAQVVSLLSKLIASAALYFVGSFFAGSRAAFWGVLILSILPDSAEYGSDVLSNWPCIMFLTTGFLLLLWGSQLRKNWMFGWAGVAAGLGFLVRTECGQVVLFGSLWLVLNLIKPQGKTKRLKAAGALVLLLAGFAAIAIPYMQSIGYVFPRQGIWKLSAILNMSHVCFDSAYNTNMSIAGLPLGKIVGSDTLITNMCELLEYYFILPLAAGCYYYFRNRIKTPEQIFFAAAVIMVNIAIAFWQSSYLGFLSKRHVLILAAFTIFYIPPGLYAIALWMNKKSLKNGTASEENLRKWFFILMTIGICICAAKLVRVSSMRGDKQGYKETAEWLNKNTAPADIIAVPDRRIAFYAERQSLEFDQVIPEQANYAVKIIGKGEKGEFDGSAEEKYSTPLNKHEKSLRLVTYKVIHKKP